MKKSQHGGVFAYILISIALVGLLTYAILQMRAQPVGANTSVMQKREQVVRLVQYGTLLTDALQQMIANGADPATLAGNLDRITGGNAWDTAPHGFKIFHPYGGGVQYMSQTGTGSVLHAETNLANNFQIRTGSYVKGVGATDATDTPNVPDIILTASVASLEVCRLINTMVLSPALSALSPPTVEDATAYGNLFTETAGATNATLEDTTPTCTNCVNRAQSCVRDSGSTNFGYYRVLLPG